jgi:hypothetical protein
MLLFNVAKLKYFSSSEICFCFYSFFFWVEVLILLSQVFLQIMAVGGIYNFFCTADFEEHGRMILFSGFKCWLQDQRYMFNIKGWVADIQEWADWPLRLLV